MLNHKQGEQKGEKVPDSFILPDETWLITREPFDKQQKVGDKYEIHD